MLITIQNFIIFIVTLISYIIIDFLLGDLIKGKYYFLHFINNMMVVYFTIGDVFNVYIDLDYYINIPLNFAPLIITISLHLYHIILYYNKLRFDDWLHHILMIFILAPLSVFLKAGSLINHALFFLTGLPGGIDYLLLFLNRNHLISKIFEKKINCFLNLYIRCPGCIAHTVLGILTISKKIQNEHLNLFHIVLAFIACSITYWNGIYFMNQVVQNYAIHQYINNKIK